MIRKKGAHRVEIREKMVGGLGNTELRHILEKDEMGGHGRLFAVNVLQPGCSIGWHVHKGEYEVYHMLWGEAVYEDSDHSRTVMKPGDTSLIENGGGHAIANESDKEAAFLAVVLFA
ncbi:MAG: cupin domain-containing protein [Synergistaceae bacterium]|jgi:quercetin dioxygenase-like cupin family protein|nr:cupin domain-containing protein [Synergistaceae bacterium]